MTFGIAKETACERCSAGYTHHLSMNPEISDWLRRALKWDDAKKLRVAIELEYRATVLRASVCRECPQVTVDCPAQCRQQPRVSAHRGN